MAWQVENDALIEMKCERIIRIENRLLMNYPFLTPNRRIHCAAVLSSFTRYNNTYPNPSNLTRVFQTQGKISEFSDDINRQHNEEKKLRSSFPSKSSQTIDMSIYLDFGC